MVRLICMTSQLLASIEKETHVHTTQEASYCFPSLGLKNALKERRSSIRDPVHKHVFFLVIFRIPLMSEAYQKAEKLIAKEDISQNYVRYLLMTSDKCCYLFQKKKYPP